MKKPLLFACLLALLAGCSKKDEPTNVVKDICGNTYPIVTIGTQIWMAENYRCSKYDTQSEAYNASWLTNNTLPTSDSYTYTPYYTDASDKSKWWSTTHSGNLSDAQVAKLGYLYNWAAAVGLANGQSQTSAFTGNRQGICPNGWHIPSKAEWSTLANYIDGNDGATDAGKKLKTTSSWYSRDEYYKAGVDTYGFAALPAGNSSGSSVYYVGYYTFFCTATPIEYFIFNSYHRHLYYSVDGLTSSSSSKDYGQSVRCLKN